MKSREHRIKQIIREQGIDGLIVLSPENFHYITGMGCHQHNISRFSGVSIAVVSAEENIKSVAISMDFEEEALKERITNCIIKKYDTWVCVKTWDAMLSDLEEGSSNSFKSFSGSLDVLVSTVKEMDLENKKNWNRNGFYINKLLQCVSRKITKYEYYKLKSFFYFSKVY